MSEVKTALEGALKIIPGQTGTAEAAAGSLLGYVTGVDFEYGDSPIHIYNGSSYAHSKKQRAMGKVTIKQAFVDASVYSAVKGGTTANESYKRNYGELQINGIAGTVAEVFYFTNMVLESPGWSVPETEEVTNEMAFFASEIGSVAVASKRIT